jgi:hypothetical protein
MPKVIGGLTALVALAAGILCHVDPLDCLWRAAIAFILGLVGTQAWYVFFTIRTQSSDPYSSLQEQGPES